MKSRMCLLFLLFFVVIIKNSDGEKGFKIMDDSYHVTVNYDITIEEAVEKGEYDVSESLKILSCFQTEEKGEKDVTLKIISFDRKIKSKEVLAIISETNFRPANFRELLSLGENCPGMQRKNKIISLIPGIFSERGSECVPVLWGVSNIRCLNIFLYETEWDMGHYFLIVEK